MMIGRFSIFAVARITSMVLMVAGCSVGPDYRAPAFVGPPAWNSAPSSQPSPSTSQPSALTEWWNTLHDPLLNSLISRAVKFNPGLEVAAARVREVRAQRGAAAAAFWPQIDSNASYDYRSSSLNTQSKTSDNQGLGRQILRNTASSMVRSLTSGQTTGTNVGTSAVNQLVTTLMNRQSSSKTSRGQNMFQAGFDASWEIDIWGGTRRSVEAATADLQASEENLRNVLVSLLAEVGVNYIELRGAQRRLAIAEDNIGLQKRTLEMVQGRLIAGFVSEVDVAQAQAQYRTTQSQVPLLESMIRQYIHQLSVLVGEPPGALMEELRQSKPLPVPPPEVPMGLPSDLLRRRPDIREAERTLAADTARIGVAMADLFPRFSLNGSLGPQTIDMQHFLDRNSLSGSVGPSITWPVFQGGRILANIEAQNARQEQSLASYRQTVLNAFQEVEDAMTAYSSEKARREAIAGSVVANQKAVDLSSALYNRGFVDFLRVLESQRSLYSSQDELASSDITAMTNLVALYKALGGGWDSFAERDGTSGKW